MAVGDVISDISAVAGSITMQPAAGVKVLITSYSDKGGSTTAQITDGTLTTNNLSIPRLQIAIDNTNYLTCTAGASESTHYAGLQIG